MLGTPFTQQMYPRRSGNKADKNPVNGIYIKLGMADSEQQMEYISKLYSMFSWSIGRKIEHIGK